MKKWIISIVVVILLVLIGVGIYHHRKNKTSDPTVKVTQGDIIEQAEAVGYIKPLHSITIKSQIDGTIEEIYHYEGEYVKKDTPLVKVKPAPAPSDYVAAHQQLDEATANEEGARINVIRFKREIKEGLISKDYGDYTNAVTVYEAAKTKRILAAQRLALLDVGKTAVAGKPIANIVVSPIEGYILNRNINVGDPVLSLSSYQSSTVLFSMSDMKNLMFEGLVDEMDAVKVKEKMPAEVKVGTIPDQVILGAVSKIALQSEKENISQGGQSSNVNAPFNVGFKTQITSLQIPPGMILRSGYSATAQIKVRIAKNVLLLPLRTIQFKGDDQYVLLPPQGKEKPKHQPVKIGITDGVNVEIKSGLQLGDVVLDKVETTAEQEE